MRSYAIHSWLAAVLAGAGAMFAMAVELPPLDIPVCDKPPKLDGNIDDPAWKNAARINNLYLINTNIPAPETTLWLMRDNAWLFIAAHCRNTTMPYVAQVTRDHDGPVSKDDSLEIFIRPTSGENDPYYHFMLNFANVGREQRCAKAGLRETEWNPIWRTVTQRHRDLGGWTATIAIPWFLFGTNDLSGMQINLCRNLAVIELDSQGAKPVVKNQTILHQTLRPDNKGDFHDFSNFRAVGGLGGFKPQSEAALFAPRIVAASVTGLRQDGRKKFYDLKVALDIATPVAGTVKLKVLEDLGEGEVEALSQPADVKGRMELELQIPAGDLRARKVKVVLADPAEGRPLAERALDKINLARDVILKDKQPFFRGKTVPTARAATFVVAAADSPDHVKAQADFICEGLDDHVVINAAIAALPENGGQVHLGAGTFNIGGMEGMHGGVSIFRSNVLLTGEGNGTRLILQPGQTDINVIWIRGNISDITVRDLFINGNAKQQGTHIRARSGWNGNNGIKAIDPQGSNIGPTPRNIKVENCRIEDCVLMAVMLTGENVEVINCYFTGYFGNHVIELLGYSGRIEGCTLRMKDGDSAGFGFSVDASCHYSIVNNKIFIDAGGAIRSHPINNWPPKLYGDGTKTNLYHGIIADNMVINNGQTGPVLIQGYMDMVHNNIFRGVPVVIGNSPLVRTNASRSAGAIGVVFEHNMLINSALEVNSPNRGDDCLILINGNEFFNSGVTYKDGNVVWGLNPGYVTENSGTATISNGQTAVVVDHGLAAAATAVHVTPASSMGAAKKFWVEPGTGRYFTIKLDADPGTAAALFNWRASMGGRK